jgi:ribosomal protein S27AE
MSNQSWWDRNLNNTEPRTTTPPTSLPGRAPYVPYQTSPSPQVQYDPRQDRVTVSKAQSTRHSGYCPECGSGNYMNPPGSQRMRCYDCGYPITQSGSGGGMPSESSGPSRPAKQVAKSGFFPNTFIGKIDSV